MSPVSDSIKTSILFGLAIVFVHLLAKNHVARSGGGDGVTTASRATRSPPITEMWDTAEPAPVAASPAIAAVAKQVAVAVASDAADVLDYVFGPANMVSTLPAAAVQTAPEKKAETKPEEPQSATSGLHLVIGSYDNENTMCGGRIFEGAGALQGFDDSDSAFAPY